MRTARRDTIPESIHGRILAAAAAGDARTHGLPRANAARGGLLHHTISTGENLRAPPGARGILRPGQDDGVALEGEVGLAHRSENDGHC